MIRIFQHATSSLQLGTLSAVVSIFFSVFMHLVGVVALVYWAVQPLLGNYYTEKFIGSICLFALMYWTLSCFFSLFIFKNTFMDQRVSLYDTLGFWGFLLKSVIVFPTIACKVAAQTISAAIYFVILVLVGVAYLLIILLTSLISSGSMMIEKMSRLCRRVGQEGFWKVKRLLEMLFLDWWPYRVEA